MTDKNTASIGFEKKIWDAACVLRGNMDASEYKSVVLGLIFLKYISDRFEEKYQQLIEEGDGFEEDVDEYISEGIFFVPENARWRVIASKAHTAEIGTVIDEAMRAIEKENTYKAFCDGTLENQKGFCAVVDTEEIAKQDYILTPGRYVGIEEQEDDGEPFEEKMTRLTGELCELFAQSHALEEEIRQKLEAIGYGI